MSMTSVLKAMEKYGVAVVFCAIFGVIVLYGGFKAVNFRIKKSEIVLKQEIDERKYRMKTDEEKNNLIKVMVENEVADKKYKERTMTFMQDMSTSLGIITERLNKLENQPPKRITIYDRDGNLLQEYNEIKNLIKSE